MNLFEEYTTDRGLIKYSDLLFDDIEHLVRWVSGKRVLDLGCGQANFVNDILDVLPPGQEIYGVDINPCIENPNVVLANFTHLPFPDKSFNRIIAGFTYGWYAKSAKEFINHTREVARICNIGGLIKFKFNDAKRFDNSTLLTLTSLTMEKGKVVERQFDVMISDKKLEEFGIMLVDFDQIKKTVTLLKTHDVEI